MCPHINKKRRSDTNLVLIADVDPHSSDDDSSVSSSEVVDMVSWLHKFYDLLSDEFDESVIARIGSEHDVFINDIEENMELITSSAFNDDSYSSEIPLLEVLHKSFTNVINSIKEDGDEVFVNQCDIESISHRAFEMLSSKIEQSNNFI